MNLIKNQYMEFEPSYKLKDLVECYWYSYRLNSNKSTMILPDTCMDFVFNLNDLRYGKDSHFVGLMMKPTEHTASGVSEYFGIRFKPFTIIKYLKVDAIHLTDQSIPLADLLGIKAKKLEYRLIETEENSERVKITEEYLIDLIREDSKDDSVVDSALEIINSNLGDVKIKELAGDLYISEKQLQRKFMSKIGTTPKKFIDILRLRELTNYMRNEEIKILSALHDYGFYDHSHYLRVKKKYYSK